MLYQLFRLIQQSGMMALESHVEAPEASPILSKFPKFLARHHEASFLTDSIKVMIMGGISAHDLEALMDEDLQVHHDEESKAGGHAHQDWATRCRASASSRRCSAS